MMPEETPVPPPEKTKRWKLWLIIAGALLLCLGLSLLVLVHLIFSPWREIPMIYPEREDFVLQNKLFATLSKTLDDAGGLPEKAALSLTPKEVNSLFRLAANVQGKKMPYPVRYYAPALSGDGVLSLTVPVLRSDFPRKNSAVFVSTAFTFAKEKQKLDVKVTALKIGRLDLSVFRQALTSEKLAEAMKELKKAREYELFDQTVESVAFDKGVLTVVYRPRELRRLIRR